MDELLSKIWGFVSGHGHIWLLFAFLTLPILRACTDDFNESDTISSEQDSAGD